MRSIEVCIWGCVFGQDTKVKTMQGTLQELTDRLFDLDPVRLEKAHINKALKESVWASEVEWVGGHCLGIEFNKVVESL